MHMDYAPAVSSFDETKEIAAQLAARYGSTESWRLKSRFNGTHPDYEAKVRAQKSPLIDKGFGLALFREAFPEEKEWKVPLHLFICLDKNDPDVVYHIFLW